MLKKFSEKLWENYVKKYPDKFLNEKLEFFKQQHKVKSGVVDLVFKDSDQNLVIVELQLSALDRNHFYKVFDYKVDLQKKYKNKKIRIILLCNEIKKKRSSYINTYRKEFGLEIEIKVIPTSKVKKIIQGINPTIGFQKDEKIKKKRNKDLIKDIQNKNDLISKEVDKLSIKSKIDNGKNKTKYMEELLIRIYPTKELRDNEIWKHYCDISSDLSSYGYVKFSTTKECVEWENKLRKIIFDIAEKSVKHLDKSDDEKYNLTKCPLCDELPYRPYGSQGWLLYNTGKDSLEHHLGGSRSSNINCNIYEYLTEDVEARFDELVYEEIKREKLLKEERRSKENIYQINREDKPKLLEDGFSNFPKPKNLNKLEVLNKVEKRLFEIGFKKNKDNNIISYTHNYVGEHGSYFIFADPRHTTRIVFKIYSNNDDFESSFVISDNARLNNLKKLYSKKLKDLKKLV